MNTPEKMWPTTPESDLPDYEKIAQHSAPNLIFPTIELDRLPILNEHHDVEAIEISYRDLLHVAEHDIDSGIDTVHAVAHLLHLDYYAGSLIRHDARSAAEQPLAQRVLTSLGRMAGTVPIGTIFTYTSCNGVKPWTFTGTRQEMQFINIVRNHISATDIGVAAIIGAVREEQGGGTIHPSRIRQFEQAAERLKRISRVFHRTVASGGKRQAFIDILQPYFGSISLHGRKYDRASGAHGPAQVIDAMVWGGKSMKYHPGYQQHKSHMRQMRSYLTPNHRHIVQACNELTDGADVLTLARRGDLSTEFLVALGGLLTAQSVFRKTHEQEARRSFALRRRGSTGSGGGTPDSLRLLRDLNTQAMEEMSRTVEARM